MASTKKRKPSKVELSKPKKRSQAAKATDRAREAKNARARELRAERKREAEALFRKRSRAAKKGARTKKVRKLVIERAQVIKHKPIKAQTVNSRVYRERVKELEKEINVLKEEALKAKQSWVDVVSPSWILSDGGGIAVTPSRARHMPWVDEFRERMNTAFDGNGLHAVSLVIKDQLRRIRDSQDFEYPVWEADWTDDPIDESELWSLFFSP